MRFATALSTDTDTDTAVQAVIEDLRAELDAPVTWAAVFVSPHHVDRAEAILAALSEAVGGVVFGSSAAGVVGAGCEVEQAPAIAVLAASMPGVHARAVHWSADVIADVEPATLARELVTEAPPRVVIALPDPFSIDTLATITALDAALPDGVPVVGGQVSGGTPAGGQVLFADGAVHTDGMLAVVLCGEVSVQTVVAQGCRPVGPPMFVTACAGNHIQQLDGRPATEVLGEVYAGLDPADQALFQQELFLGVQMQEQTEYAQGDFLVRHVQGVPRDEEGSLAVAFRPERYQVVQVHLRDAATSADDLRAMVRRWAASPDSRPPRGMLMFQCLGRGVGLYGEPDHDSRLLLAELGVVPTGGFFCNGELGPVHGRTHLHGYTSVIALFADLSR